MAVKVDLGFSGEPEYPLKANFSMLLNCIGCSVAELHLEKQIFPSQRQNLRFTTQHRNIQYNFTTWNI